MTFFRDFKAMYHFYRQYYYGPRAFLETLRVML